MQIGPFFYDLSDPLTWIFLVFALVGLAMAGHGYAGMLREYGVFERFKKNKED